MIIHSDDFGYKNYTDNKIIQLIAKGNLKSVSVISNMVERKNLKRLVKMVNSSNNVKIGLHINLIEGKSLYNNKYIPSLVDRKNNLLGLPKFFLKLVLKMIDENHIEREINKQITHLEDNGIKVTILDSHEHVHALSPIAEIVEKIARERGIKKIRSYKNVKNHTLIAKTKYGILKIMGLISHFIYKGKIDLPSSWKIDSLENYSYMSWEGEDYDISKLKDKALILVTHPYLPFDSNKSYFWFLV
ncbi:hypothetical protein A3D78_05690 [Candidatus Gottesmanbacteria bacterium RIFCSPHIGHO2_02_FULL_39_14]|uniref:ChbG/HpnK family deacetylase n=2 Tax=Candidatus Gottesmaniibacteriota TaxID=1752720 RepID=A0A1F6A2P4_9BACT|nr:MAG: hypothetical protein A3D78_05690 [Candidatus Gottesmanbacteria bacterium RIFCSPHIGHO2_02_FULL_39_14]OGG31204.1 MAG: hypothetical protein A3I51_04980 [Candidatus Gottesmanbacteria bacterium RIFCSPLOWO2_02_FULL_38_8]